MIFGPLTTYGVYFILNIFSNPVLVGNIISLGAKNFEIINACVIGAAYYLLFILFMSFQKIDIKKRIYSIATSFTLLYLANVLRIIFLIAISNNLYFEQIHWVFWNIISTLFVVIIFVLMVHIYKIKEIPFMSDIRLLWQMAKPVKKKKRSSQGHKRGQKHSKTNRNKTLSF